MLRCTTGEVPTSYQTFVTANPIGHRQPPVCLGYNGWEWTLLLTGIAALVPLAYFTIRDLILLNGDHKEALNYSITINVIIFYLIVTAFVQLLHGVFWLRKYDLYSFLFTIFIAALTLFVDFFCVDHSEHEAGELARVIIVSGVLPLLMILVRLVSVYSLEFHIIGAPEGLIIMYKMYRRFLSLIKSNLQMSVAYCLFCIGPQLDSKEPHHYVLYGLLGFSLLEWIVAKLSISTEMKSLVFVFVLLGTVSLLWIPVQGIWLTRSVWHNSSIVSLVPSGDLGGHVMTECDGQCLTLRYGLLTMGTALVALKVPILYSLLGVFRNFGYGLTDRERWWTYRTWKWCILTMKSNMNNSAICASETRVIMCPSELDGHVPLRGNYRNHRNSRSRDGRSSLYVASVSGTGAPSLGTYIHKTTHISLRSLLPVPYLRILSIISTCILLRCPLTTANQIPFGPILGPLDPIKFNAIYPKGASSPFSVEPKWMSYDANSHMYGVPNISSLLMPSTTPTSHYLHVHTLDPKAVDEALEFGRQSVEDVGRLEHDLLVAGSMLNMTRISTQGRHAVAPYDPQRVKFIHDEQQLFEQATKMLAKNLSLPIAEISRLESLMTSETKLARKARQICAMDHPISCFNSRYRTADGSCNNIHQPLWGKSNTCLGRLIESEYADGISAPKISVTGSPLPNPRVISTLVHVHRDRRDKFTQLLMQWGQFLDHDMSFTPLVQSSSGQALQCCPSPSHPECFPIAIPRDDPFYSRVGQSCMNFIRSTTCGSCSLGPRQQLTQITAFLDASQVYGNMLNQTISLRTLDGTGRLKFSLSLIGTPLLPLSQNGNDQCSQREESLICFRSGDIRVNQNPGLTSLQTIFLRQHNRVAKILSKINPHWQEEVIFQETRRVIGAQMQVIAYREFLPLVLGEDAMRYYKLHLLEHGYTDYDPEIEPTILSEFSTAAYRFGHSQVQGMMSRITASGLSTTFNLRDFYFFPFDLFEGKLDSIMRGLIGRSAQKADPFLHGDVRNHLYKPRGDAFGTDLASFNINRGRDHGIPGYIKYLSYCFDEHVDSFEELDHYMPSTQRLKLQKIYKHVEDIDLWTGGLSEYPLEGALVGPTFSCIIGIQFHHLKFGDRFWFEHGHQPGSFTPGQLQSLRHTSLAKIICENGDHFRFVHQHVFLRESAHDPIRPCEEVEDLDFMKWKDFAYSG